MRVTPYQKRIKKFLKKPSGELSYNERLELIDYRYNVEHQAVSYHEFVMLCFANQELEFTYNGKSYEIVNGIKGNTKDFFWDSTYEGKGKNRKCVWEKQGNYSSIEELLDKVRIDGKSIKEIWDSVNQ